MVGIEPTTYGLRNRCSTTELHWRSESAANLYASGRAWSSHSANAANARTRHACTFARINRINRIKTGVFNTRAAALCRSKLPCAVSQLNDQTKRTGRSPVPDKSHFGRLLFLQLIEDVRTRPCRPVR